MNRCFLNECGGNMLGKVSSVWIWFILLSICDYRHLKFVFYWLGRFEYNATG